MINLKENKTLTSNYLQEKYPEENYNKPMRDPESGMGFLQTKPWENQSKKSYMEKEKIKKEV